MDQAEGLRRMQRSRPVRVIAVTSGKGGVGKTNISVNLAMALSAANLKVMILDADLGLANIDIMLGLSPQYNLSHVMSGEKRLSEIIVDGPADLKIIPASSGVAAMSSLSEAENAAIIRAFSEISYELDVFLVDTAAGIDNSVVSFCKASQEVIVVVCDEPASITDAYALIKLLNREHDIYRFHVLANMVHSVKEGRELFLKILRATDKFLDVSLDFMGTVPYDMYLRKAVQKQSPVVQVFPQSPSALAFRNLAQKTIRWPMPKMAGGYLEFFLERLVAG